MAITLIGHGTLVFAVPGQVVHVDPWSKLADYSQMPKADVILITHEHADHLDPKAVETLRKESTVILLTQACADKVPGGKVIKNGETQTVAGLKIEAVPAYNIVQKRPDGTAFHPKGSGNGYVINFGKTRVYVAGDTENIAEMKNLKKIAVAFLPMNLPYTMTPEHGGRCGQVVHAQDSVSVSLRPNGSQAACGSPQRPKGHRGSNPGYEVEVQITRV